MQYIKKTYQRPKRTFSTSLGPFSVPIPPVIVPTRHRVPSLLPSVVVVRLSLGGCHGRLVGGGWFSGPAFVASLLPSVVVVRLSAFVAVVEAVGKACRK